VRRLLLCLFFGLFASFSALAAVDINTADASELETLPGIGPSKAAAIVQYRTDHGPFATVDQLDDVPGIGPSTMANLHDLVTVGKGKPGTTATAASTPTTSTSSALAPSATASAPKASSGGCPVNINTADAAGLQNLPGIGASKAAAIVQHRTDNGPFASCDALDDVSGIGPSTLAGLKDCCTVK
jgi:competence protein ComEA